VIVLEKNLTFSYLKAIGIILVVIGHCGGGGIGQIFAVSWFPTYSFHQPLFVFIAGYLYHDSTSTFQYLFKRAKRLLLPFYGWHLIYGILVTVLTVIGWIDFGKTLTFETFVLEPWTVWNNGYKFNLASWFLTGCSRYKLSMH
jgi:fucose 4-O-acetylase-like acetyltransferase